MRRLLPMLLLLAACHHAKAPDTTVKAVDKTPPPPVAAEPCPMPENYQIDAMAKPLIDKLGAAAELHVLAWQEEQDRVGDHSSSAILWMKRSDGGVALAQVYRYGNTADMGWSLVGDSPPNLGSATFDAAPTHAELDAFLEVTGWTFAPSGYKMLDNGVCTGDWQTAFGEPPWHAYK